MSELDWAFQQLCLCKEVSLVTFHLMLNFIAFFFQVDTLYGRDIPTLKMFKRQLKHFEEGRRASITLVFYASHPVTVRWFIMPSRLYLGASEIENMLPIEGNLHLNGWWFCIWSYICVDGIWYATESSYNFHNGFTCNVGVMNHRLSPLISWRLLVTGNVPLVANSPVPVQK